MNRTVSAPYRVSFNYRFSKVRIQRPILDVLGRPKFIKMLLAPEEKLLYIVGIDEREKDCFPVPLDENMRHNGFVLHGQYFIKRISSIAGWELDRSHLISGEYDAERRSIVFDLRHELLDATEDIEQLM